MLADFPRSVRHWLPVHVYHAASHAEGHVALLESAPLTAGQSAMVELVLATPLHPKFGDRLVLRDHAMEHTIGGGRVIDTAPPEKARRAPKRLACLEAKRTDDATLAMRRLVELQDVDIDAFRRVRNLTEEAFGRRARRNGSRVASARYAHARGVEGEMVGRVGIARIADRRLSQSRAAQSGVEGRSDPPHWSRTKGVVGRCFGRAGRSGQHRGDRRSLPRTEPPGRAAARRGGGVQEDTGRDPRRQDQPPSIGDIAKSLGMPLRSLDALINRLAKLGFLTRAGDHRVLLPDQLARIRRNCPTSGEVATGGFTARDFRDAAGVGRNLAIDVLEYFDRCGFTRRYGDVRRIVGDPSTVNRA